MSRPLTGAWIETKTTVRARARLGGHANAKPLPGAGSPMIEKRKHRKSPNRDDFDADTYARLKAMPPFRGQNYWNAQRRFTADNAAKRLRELKLQKAKPQSP